MRGTRRGQGSGAKARRDSAAPGSECPVPPAREADGGSRAKQSPLSLSDLRGQPSRVGVWRFEPPARPVLSY